MEIKFKNGSFIKSIGTSKQNRKEQLRMIKYEKLETVFSRDMNGTKKLIEGVFRNSTVEFLKDNVWEWTEKVDGTNIGIVWDGYTVSFQGRTEKTKIPTHLLDKLNAIFGTSETEQLFEEQFGDRNVILFGEGYGNKIQGAGKQYIPNDVGFILFDLWIEGNYQSRESVERAAKAFGIPVVPIVGSGTLSEAIAFIKGHPQSTLGDLPMEGIVCRPMIELRDRCGNRVITKIKWKDFKDLV